MKTATYMGLLWGVAVLTVVAVPAIGAAAGGVEGCGIAAAGGIVFYAVFAVLLTRRALR